MNMKFNVYVFLFQPRMFVLYLLQFSGKIPGIFPHETQSVIFFQIDTVLSAWNELVYNEFTLCDSIYWVKHTF